MKLNSESKWWCRSYLFSLHAWAPFVRLLFDVKSKHTFIENYTFFSKFIEYDEEVNPNSTQPNHVKLNPMFSNVTDIPISRSYSMNPIFYGLGKLEVVLMNCSNLHAHIKKYAKA